MIYLNLIISFFTITSGNSHNGYSCLDESGSPVDSWIALAQNDKYQYYIYTPLNGFIKSPYRTNQTTNGCIMSTINQLYSPTLDLNNIAYGLYNDDPPPPLDVASSTFAHSKGVVLTNNESGFWLIHSKPNWPNQRSGGAIPFPDSTYAQSLMCITMNTTMFETAASGFLINYPYIYDSYISSNLVSTLPTFNSWVNQGKSSVTNMTFEIISRAGKSFLQFAKSKSWGKDLYDDFVAPFLNQSIHVETWRSGSGGRMGSVCENTDDDTWTINPSYYDIIEVSVVTMPDGATWKGTSDHSKWVSTIGFGPICIGDINRMCSQESRGGGTVCVTDLTTQLWDSFDSAITSVEDCWAYNPCAGSSTQCYWCPSKSPTMRPTLVPSIAGDPTISATPTILIDVLVGDVAIILIDTDNPDTFSVVALSSLPNNFAIKFTDNGWTGTALNSNEGTLQFTTSIVVPAGSMWSYDGTAMTNEYGTWTKIQGTFSLSTAGDQILVYSGDSNSPFFLFGLSTIPWVSIGTTIDTTTSVLPSTLSTPEFNSSIAFNDVDNGMYNGTTTGTKNELILWIGNTANWLTSDTTLYAPSQLKSFHVLEPSASPTFLPSLIPSTSPTQTPTAAPSNVPTKIPTNIYETLTVNERTVQCYSDCTYPEMTLPPTNWSIFEYCDFYSATSCSIPTVSSYTCSPTCLLDCVDVFCDTMSSLVYLCNSNLTLSYTNKSIVQSSCLQSYSSTSPTKTLMTFTAAVVFNDVAFIDLNTIESKEIAILGMEMSISGVTWEEIKIESIVDGSSTRRSLNIWSSSTHQASNVTYKFSVILESLGYDSTTASSAYTQLTKEINSSIDDESLQQNLKVAGTTAGITTFSSLTITTMPQYTSAILTPIMTTSPSSSPTFDQNSNSGDNENNNPVPSLVFYLLGGIGGLALFVLSLLMILKRNQRKKKYHESFEIETRNTLSESPLQYEA